ncbi:MAG TPA: hypothetical protein VKT80_08430, partial [Chloroflexota bacterium]|nr:hypothetical protein [Chloroflexota bacterium]
ATSCINGSDSDGGSFVANGGAPRGEGNSTEVGYPSGEPDRNPDNYSDPNHSGWDHHRDATSPHCDHYSRLSGQSHVIGDESPTFSLEHAKKNADDHADASHGDRTSSTVGIW